jgi:hypothetical protein
VPIITHALWDFSLFSHGTSKAAVVAGDQLFLQGLQGALPLILFIVVMIAHKQWMSSDEPATATHNRHHGRVSTRCDRSYHQTVLQPIGPPVRDSGWDDVARRCTDRS